MRWICFKYLVIMCIALTLFLKVCNVMSYLKLTNPTVELASMNEDSTEKEEKKIEPEYFTDQFFLLSLAEHYPSIQQKIIIPDHFFQLAYFPEVLTPPPAI
ncbi:hypothetical protein [Pedobacter frigidisoli]|uniref:hypothetical protein n=1 Tax=Pedobacter frigidisoli TaxID=2530455 RepID=UPI00292E4718|nr:hypothetical protein [Pedobacter frigidisoli]